MSFTPAAAGTLRRALATVVPVTRSWPTQNPAEARHVTETAAAASNGKDEIRTILDSWGLT